MLTIQRASAGSGKTYALAKKYLWFLLTVVPVGGGRRRLRRPAEIPDAASHILAITFTNKATNEMKQRIVEKLASLASATAPGRDPMKADYMKDFCHDLAETPQHVSEVAAIALRELLNSYGDFHVTTIDSFFQTVLRTFAYETDLDDNYSLELDSEYVARVGMDSMLEDINEATPSEETRFWLNLIMERRAETGRSWNVFQRTPSRHSIYKELIDVVKRMEKEDFKMVRASLDRYFDTNPDLRSVYSALSDKYEAPIREAHAEMQRLAKEIQDLCLSEGLSLTEEAEKNLNGRIEKALSTLWHSEKSANGTSVGFSVKGRPAKPENVLSTSARPRLKGTPLAARLHSLVMEFYDAHDRWLGILNSGQSGLWMLYRANLPYLGLLQSVRGHIRRFLEDNNMVELAETNSMLRRIIGHDDTPFIYERLGTRLNHFLIDEFQDTSLLQWLNLRPLLSESEGRGHDNLIIGDAKQSIYRFRNADPSLITSVVPEAFPGHKAAGMSIAENTNWRSDLRIVRFNNYFFNALAAMLDSDGKVPDLADGIDRSMKSLYAGIVQHSHHREEQGYVEVNLITKRSDEEAGELPPHYHDIADLIFRLRERGYAQRDIAVLVEKHDQAAQTIEALIEWNDANAGLHLPIDFISDQSLLLGASEAVRLVIGALESICAALRPEIRTGEERRHKGVADWDNIRCNFNFFAMSHPEMSPAEQLNAFLASEHSADALSDMLASMQAVTLPAIVEAVADKFIPPSLRNADAPYLAALQDAVADYCQGYSADIASFLDWWRLRGANISISSPEETDAVRIMTIHKSKGLEFACVIIPSASAPFSPSATSRPEWRWVEPVLPEAPDMPPFVPVDTDKTLEGTPHAGEYGHYLYLHRMDKMNAAYVAFTRAVHELYIFAPVVMDKKTGAIRNNNSPGHALYQLLTEMDANPNGHDMEMPAPDELEISDTGLKISYGELPDPSSFAKKEASSASQGNDGRVIGEYYVNSGRALLAYTNADVPEATDGEEEDPRAEGNLLHAAMADIRTPRDVERAVLRLKVQGLVAHDRVKPLADLLHKALDSVASRGWYDGSWQVVNERPVISAACPDRRPDRLMVSPDGRHAVVVDYKFGAYHSDSRYRRQVEGYVGALLETGRFDTVSGYLWYVKEGIVEAV